LLTDFVCLLTYEFCPSLWKITRCSVILLLPLWLTPLSTIFNYIEMVVGGRNRGKIQHVVYENRTGRISELTQSCVLYLIYHSCWRPRMIKLS